MSIILMYEVTGRLWERPKKLKRQLLKTWDIKKGYFYSHGCQDQKYCKVDLDDHVYVLLSKDPCSEADDDKEQGWDKNSQQVVDNRSSKGDFNDNGLHFVDDCITHANPAQGILAKRNVGVVLKINQMKICLIGSVENFHSTNLCVKRIPVIFILTVPLYIVFQCQTEGIF